MPEMSGAGKAIMDTASKRTLRESLMHSRTSPDSACPSLEEAEPYERAEALAVERKPDRKLRNTVIGVALVALLAGGVYLAFGSATEHDGSEPGTEPIAQNSIPRLAPDARIDAPLYAKNASLDIAGTINAARLSMVRGALGDARTRLAMLPASESKRDDVRQITNELIQRELARDAAIGLARACEKAGDNPCVLRAAGDALASDVSDSEARDMLLRAVAQTGVPGGPAIVAPSPGVTPTAIRRTDTRIVARRRPERLMFRRDTQSFANLNDIYSKP